MAKTSDREKSPPNQVKTYDNPLRNFLETTSVKGVSKVVKSTNTVYRVLWLSALILELAAATFFTYNLFYGYFSYKAVLYMDKDSVKAKDFPDITLCNLNPFANSPFRSNEINELFDMVGTVYNSNLTSFLGRDIDLFKIAEFHDAIRPGRLFEFLIPDLPEHGWNESSNFVVHCGWDTDLKSYDCMSQARVMLYSTDYGYCFTFTQPQDSTFLNGFSAILYADTSSFVTTMPAFPLGIDHVFTDGARVILHPKGTLPLLREGVNVETGFLTTVGISLNRIEKLGEPYSDCAHDPHLHACWQQEPDVTDAYIYSKEACEDFCFQHDLIAKCGCISGKELSVYGMRENISYCGYRPEGDLVAQYNASLEAVDCYYSVAPSACSIPCTSDTYDLTLYRTVWPHPSYQVAFYEEHIKNKPYADEFLYYENISTLAQNDLRAAYIKLKTSPLIRDNFLQVNIVWHVRNVTHLKETSFWTAENLIGTLGGVLNLWVGISFVTVIEILEMFLNACHCAFKSQNIQADGPGQNETPKPAWEQQYVTEYVDLEHFPN